MAMKKYGKRMGWVAGINKIAVAEMTISHMINILRNFHKLAEKLEQEIGRPDVRERYFRGKQSASTDVETLVKKWSNVLSLLA